MTLREKIKELCKRNNISINKMEADLGFAKGYVSKLDKSTPNSEKLKKIADYFEVSLDYLMDSENSSDATQRYYLNEETAKAAQEIFENKELRALFDVQRDMDADDLKALHNMALALKRKERGFNDDDDTGC